MKIVILGAGNMGGAIAKGLVRSGIAAADVTLTRTQPSTVLADWAERLVAVCEAHVGDAHTDTGTNPHASLYPGCYSVHWSGYGA